MTGSIADVLRRLIEVTLDPPADDVSIEELLIHARATAEDREELFADLRALFKSGAQLDDYTRPILSTLMARGEKWDARLADARQRMLAEQARMTQPTGRASVYRASSK